MHDDALRARFAQTADTYAAHAERELDTLRERLRAFLPELRGDERALDVGTGTGLLARALAPLVGHVTGVDLVPELLARAEPVPNVELLEGDAAALPFDDASFDVVVSRRAIHHTSEPERVVSEMARVLEPGGLLFLDDQLGPDDPTAAFELDRFERRRDPSHHRTLSDREFKNLFAEHGLRIVREEHFSQRRELVPYLALAGCTGEAAEAARDLSPGDRDHYVAEAAWFLATR